MEEEFISDEEIGRGAERGPAKHPRLLAAAAALAAVLILIGGAYFVGRAVPNREGSGFFANIASIFRETFVGGERAPDFEFALDAESDTPFPAAPRGGMARKATVPMCAEKGEAMHGAVFISEIAWMGGEGGANREWVELANRSEQSMSIAGWRLRDMDGQIDVVFPRGASIAAGSFYLLERGEDAVGARKVDLLYTGNLRNSDETLSLFDASCNLVDTVRASPDWPAGDAGAKKTMERDPATLRWHTSRAVGGTPGSANSAPLSVSQSETPGEHSALQDVLAPTSTTPTSTPTSTQPMPPPQPAEPVHVFISEVMAGKDGATNWDFVELYNAGSNAVNLTGWSMKKKTAGGSESTLISANAKDPSASFEGRAIAAGGYFLLANAEGYTGLPPADVRWPKSYTLAYENNAVVLYDANGGKMDEVRWAEIPKGQSYARTLPAGGSFALRSSPSPQSSASP